MAEALPLQQTEMPGFSLLGMALGGRSYAANWFQQRDKLKLLQAEEERQGIMRQNAAQAIVNSPELQAATSNPYDRKAQFGLWGQFQQRGAPADFNQLGSNLLQNSVANIYNREGQTYADQLERARIKLTADEQLRVDEVKRGREASFQQKMLANVFGPDPNAGGGESRIMSDIRRTQAAQAMGLPAPAQGYVYTVDPNNPLSLAQRPLPGTKAWSEAAERIQAVENMAADAEMLLGHFTGEKTISPGEYQSYRQNLKFEMKKAFETGALDEGTIKEFDATIPVHGVFGQDQALNPLSAKASEQLRVFIHSQQRKAQQISDATYIPLSDIQNRQQQQRTVPQELVEQNRRKMGGGSSMGPLPAVGSGPGSTSSERLFGSFKGSRTQARGAR